MKSVTFKIKWYFIITVGRHTAEKKIHLGYVKDLIFAQSTEYFVFISIYRCVNMLSQEPTDLYVDVIEQDKRNSSGPG